MPYKDIERKKEWERLHRPQRLTRRRELRRIEAAQQDARPETGPMDYKEAGVAVPLVARGILAVLSPELGMALGGLTLVVAATYNYKKGWQWWIVGAVVVLVALFLYVSRPDAEVAYLEPPGRGRHVCFQDSH
jgi:cell division protein FtsW (lipid II flippase)